MALVRQPVIVAAAVVALLGAACGDDGGERAEVVWADQVCGAAQTWLDTLTGLVDDVDVGELVTEGTDAITSRLDQAASATEDLVAELDEIGVPETAATDEARAELDALYDQVRNLGQIAQDAADVDSIDEAFELFDQAVDEFSAIRDSFQTLDELDALGELRSGVEDSSACEELTG